MQDPRAGFLSAALLAEHDKGQGVATGKPIDAATGIIAAPWYKSVSRKIVGMFAQKQTPIPSAQFGIDSIISAEFRTGILNSFKVDVPSLELMSPKKSLSTLDRFVGLALDKNS
ncbi:hypothetical protein GGS24DRAFT_505800 [Hypoxylon argillaceum]|nr:hypothetical protein GGS24DRAFT_505800 [Hypoxylon argillaceum]